MPNTIASELQRSVIMENALIALRPLAILLGAFSTAFRNVPLEGTNKMMVPYYPLETASSRDFNGTYITDGSSTGVREVEINKRKYQGLSLTSAERIRQPQLKPEQIGLMKGQKLALDVVADILSLFTAANYGAAVFTGAANTFDSDDVIDIAEVCDTANWPELGRSLILKNTYKTPLLKDGDIKNYSASGTTDPLTKAVLPMIAGFAMRPTTTLPANGENLVGLACVPSCALVGFAPIPPQGDALNRLVEYETAEDESGLVLEYRRWGNPGSDAEEEVIEVNYGFGKGEAAAAKRLVSA